MDKNIARLLMLFFCFAAISCKSKANSSNTPEKIKVGAESLQKYLPLLEGKRVGLVVNHTSQINGTHLLDTLLSSGIDIQKVFAPEHGFRGDADRGAHIDNSTDSKTGVPIVSIYGKNKKPSAEQLANLDVLIYDIQDIGVRFYTYSSTLHYVIQASAEESVPLIVLDRPNPNGHYVAGPVMEKEQSSFLGLNPVPVVYGLTSGELATMINGEHWASEMESNLKVIKNENYTHLSKYEIPVKTSPNIPNNQSVYLYPSLCFFEAANISVGRGTDKQFQILGGPSEVYGNYTFVPEDKPGAGNPINEGVTCYGQDLTQIEAYSMGLDLSYFIDYYHKSPDKEKFLPRPKFFNLLMGNTWVLEDIKNGLSQEELEAKWTPALDDYKILRKKYLLYTDFE